MSDIQVYALLVTVISGLTLATLFMGCDECIGTAVMVTLVLIGTIRAGGIIQ